MNMYVGLLALFCSCLSCLKNVLRVFNVLLTVCVVVLYQRHFIDLFICIAASLSNKLTYLLKQGSRQRCTLEWEHKFAEGGNGKSTRDNGNGNGYFFTHTHTRLTAFFRDYLGEPVPER